MYQPSEIQFGRNDIPFLGPSAEWYSHNFGRTGLLYEIGISIYENRIVWI
jgi:hypothetical protein